MDKDDFINALYDANWMPNGDENHYQIINLWEKIFPVEAKLEKAENELDSYETKHDKIVNWTKAYPLSVFPEPDMDKVHKVLKENGMTLDAVAASNMRHVLSGIQKIIEG